MSQVHDYALDATKTYNYVRLSMAGLVAALGAAVAIERVSNANCFEGSISAYFYTPVHSVFVGALIAIGVGLIAIKGTRTEDLFLNLAGFMAPIVALVPTATPEVQDRCSNTPVLFHDVRPMVNNNALSLLFAGALVFAAVWWISRRRNDSSTPLLSDRRNQLGFVVSAAVLAFGSYLYFWQKRWFADHSHQLSAGLMFVFIGVVVLINARATTNRRYAKAYWAVLATMVGSAIVVGVGACLVPAWSHAVLAIEVMEIAPFMAFWGLQTAELWNAGARRVVVKELPRLL